MIQRALEPVLRRAAKQYPIVTLTGPRQSGKTTLARAAFPNHAYASLEDPDQRAFAVADPRGFLGQFRGPVILDEAQRTPDLFSYIQTAVDRDASNGRYVLTGSQSFLLMRNVSQSLAGRAAILAPLAVRQVRARGSPAALVEDPRASDTFSRQYEDVGSDGSPVHGVLPGDPRPRPRAARLARQLLPHVRRARRARAPERR